MLLLIAIAAVSGCYGVACAVWGESVLQSFSVFQWFSPSQTSHLIFLITLIRDRAIFTPLDEKGV